MSASKLEDKEAPRTIHRIKSAVIGAEKKDSTEYHLRRAPIFERIPFPFGEELNSLQDPNSNPPILEGEHLPKNVTCRARA